ETSTHQFSYFFIQRYDLTINLHSFPTRRSSDLENVNNIVDFAFTANPLLTIEVDDNNDQYWDVDGNGLYTDLQGFGIVLFQGTRSEEHTSELQSRFDLVCRLLLEKKKIVNARVF